MSRWKTVLVGVDGSPGSRKALTWAAAEAADHGADLVVLTVWEPALLPPSGSGSVPVRVPDPGEQAATDLVQVIREELGAEPPIVAQPQVVRGNPSEVLIERSASADLLVVGTRGRGGFAGLVLGSVSQHVAAYARCPVTVVRQGFRAARQGPYRTEGATEDTRESHAAALEYVVSVLPRRFRLVTSRGRPCQVIICSDHGTLYGEDGHTGHRVAHEHVWTVPYADFVLEAS